MTELLGKLVLDNITCSTQRIVAIEFNQGYERVKLENDGWRTLEDITLFPKDPPTSTEL